MKAQHTIVTLAMILLFTPPLYGQEDGVFRYIEEDTVTLTERQSELLQIIRSRPQTQAVYLVQIDENRFDMSRTAIQINLPEQLLVTEKQEAGAGSEHRTSWAGKATGIPASTVLLSVDGDDVWLLF